MKKEYEAWNILHLENIYILIIGDILKVVEQSVGLIYKGRLLVLW